jgi:N-acyl-L-homoserine lactone synthetase
MLTSHDEITRVTFPDDDEDFVASLLRGYEFRVCERHEDWDAALAIRRRVYGAGCGYDVEIPDEYDARSWLFLAEDRATGEAVGTMRVTPRWRGALEAEEYFTLPRYLRTPMALEITRFAILPEYRKGKTFLPVVSLGLFKLLWSFATRIGASYFIVCSKPERLWTYDWLRFRTTGLKAAYAKLAGAEHELISFDLQRAPIEYAASHHPFEAFFTNDRIREVVVPARIPGPGAPWEHPLDPVALGA